MFVIVLSVIEIEPALTTTLLPKEAVVAKAAFEILKLPELTVRLFLKATVSKPVMVTALLLTSLLKITLSVNPEPPVNVIVPVVVPLTITRFPKTTDFAPVIVKFPVIVSVSLKVTVPLASIITSPAMVTALLNTTSFTFVLVLGVLLAVFPVIVNALNLLVLSPPTIPSTTMFPVFGAASNVNVLPVVLLPSKK